VNLVVRNTTWVPGHFYLTVGTAVALPFFGITYWLLPHLTGRTLWAPRLGVL
jgi:cytochrome c oxidase subunit I